MNLLPLLIIPIFLLTRSKLSKSPISSISNNTIPKYIDLDNNLLAFPEFRQVKPNEKAPMIIVLHGRGGSENSLKNTIPENIKARIFYIRANTENNLFFIPKLKDNEEILIPALKESGNNLLKGIDKLKKLYPTNNLIIYAFSQGAAIALYIGSLGRANNILAFSGSLPSKLYPSELRNTKIMMFHGNKDGIVPYELALNTFNSFYKLGYDAVFIEKYNGHVFPPKDVVKKYFEWAVE